MICPRAYCYAHVIIQLNQAFRVLLDGGQLIALHEARYFAVKDGLNLGPGAFVKALEFSAGVQATVIGCERPFLAQPMFRRTGLVA